MNRWESIVDSHEPVVNSYTYWPSFSTDKISFPVPLGGQIPLLPLPLLLLWTEGRKRPIIATRSLGFSPGIESLKMHAGLLLHVGQTLVPWGVAMVNTHGQLHGVAVHVLAT